MTLWGLSVTVAAEGPPQPLPADESAAPREEADPPLAAPDLAAKLREQLRRLRESRQAAMSDEPLAVPDRPATTPAENRRLSQLRRDLVERQALWQDRQDRLNADLNRLEELFKDAPWCQPPAPVKTTAPSRPESVPASNDRPAAADSTTTPVSAPPPLIRPGPVTPAEPSPDAIPPALVEAIAVTDQPVDRLGLANNLYGTGEYNLALQIYERIDSGPLSTSDREWILYQVANCHRRLGHTAEAERSFRVVTASQQEGWCNENARWWLETTHKLTQLRKRVEQVQQGLQNLGEQPGVNANPN